MPKLPFVCLLLLGLSIGLALAISACGGGGQAQAGPTPSVSVEVSGAGEITPTPAAEPTSAGPEPSEQATELARTFGRASEKLDRLTATDRPSGDLVLVRNERFEIVWMIYNRQLVIKVFQPPYEEGRQAVTQWFLDKGFTQEELCALGEFGRIGIYPTQDAVPGDQFPGDTGPTGCPAPTAIPPQ